MVLPIDTPAWLRQLLEALVGAQVRSEERFARVEAQLDRLAAAQERTEQRLDRLAAAQERTEERLDQLTQQVTHLAAAQERTEERLDRLAAAQERTEQRLNELAIAQQRTEERLNELAIAQQRTEAQLDRLAAAQEQTASLLARHDGRLDRIEDRLGQLTGWVWETRLRDRAASYLAGVADHVQVLTPVERDHLLDPAVHDGKLTRDEARTIRLADLVCRAVDPASGESRFLVAEVSARVAGRDVERASERATLLARLGTPVIAVVAGQRIDRDAQASAERLDVRQVLAGD